MPADLGSAGSEQEIPNTVRPENRRQFARAQASLAVQLWIVRAVYGNGHVPAKFKRAIFNKSLSYFMWRGGVFTTRDRELLAWADTRTMEPMPAYPLEEAGCPTR